MGKWISGLIGGANIWLLVGLFAAGVTVGGGAAWPLATWKSEASHSVELRKLVGDTATSLATSEKNRAQERQSVLDAIEATKVKNAATATDVQSIMTKLGGLNNAIRSIEVQTVVVDVGSCHFTDAADGLRYQAWRAATGAVLPGAANPGGEADVTHGTAPGAASTDFVGRAIARGAGKGRNE